MGSPKKYIGDEKEYVGPIVSFFDSRVEEVVRRYRMKRTTEAMERDGLIFSENQAQDDVCKWLMIRMIVEQIEKGVERADT